MLDGALMWMTYPDGNAIKRDPLIERSSAAQILTGSKVADVESRISSVVNSQCADKKLIGPHASGAAVRLKWSLAEAVCNINCRKSG
jgi:hypothetical protein